MSNRSIQANLFNKPRNTKRPRQRSSEPPLQNVEYYRDRPFENIILPSCDYTEFNPQALKSKGFKQLNLSKNETVHRDDNVPVLHHGLNKVLFEKGVHPLYNTKSSTYNFPGYLRAMFSPEKVDLSSAPPFITSSRDIRLHNFAKINKCKFKGSTSSVSSVLSHLYFLFSRYKYNNNTNLPTFGDLDESIDGIKFTPSSKKPAVIYLRPNEGIYSIDAETTTKDSNSILLHHGKVAELVFTRSRKSFSDQFLAGDRERPPRVDDKYNFIRISNTLLRSQIDCHHPDLPKKTFDLKTRAIFKIRINPKEYYLYSHEGIDTVRGMENSFEREYHDLIRGALLKYILQARIGDMDGDFVAYHNTFEIFGFEYLSLEEMEKQIFESKEMADAAYEVSTNLMEKIFETITRDIPDHMTLRVVIKTVKQHRKDKKCSTFVFVEKIPIENNTEWTEIGTLPIFPNSQIDVYQIHLLPFLNNKAPEGEYRIGNESCDVWYSMTKLTDKDPKDTLSVYYDLLKIYYDFGVAKSLEGNNGIMEYFNPGNDDNSNNILDRPVFVGHSPKQRKQLNKY